MRTVFLIASVVVSAYSFILIFRVLVSWFSGVSYGRLWDFLCAITDPFLRLFRGLRFMHRGALDFTPLAAIVLLQIVAFLLNYFATALVISVLTIIASIALAVWRIIFSILIFFALVTAVRLISLIFAKRPDAYFFRILDNILEPLALLIARCFPRRRQVSYRSLLIVLLVFLAIIGGLGIGFIEPALFLLGFRAGLDVWH